MILLLSFCSVFHLLELFSTPTIDSAGTWTTLPARLPGLLEIWTLLFHLRSCQNFLLEKAAFYWDFSPFFSETLGST